LTFAKAGTRTVNVAVEKVGASGPMPAGTMSMPMPAAKH
jgi:hypothetical protein